MRRYLRRFAESSRQADLILLMLCVIASVFGCLMIASATNSTASGPVRYLLIQIPATIIGVLAYLIVSSIDTEFFSEHRSLMVVFNIGLLLLLIPFGETINGNRSWLDFPFLPFNIQPAEICKITYVLITASVMSSHQNSISSPKSVLHVSLHLVLLVLVNWGISSDAGVSLIFVAIFVGMAWGGGISLIWFGAAIGAIILAFPIIWNVIMDDFQRNRILVVLDPSLDPYGRDALYHTVRSLRSLTGGGLTGQGLFQGHRTQSSGVLFAQHTDYIFSAIGEELGFVGCIFVLVLLALIIIRCIWVGIRSQDMMRRLVCFGAASALAFQVIINTGMCMGVVPVIGLTLPFISYGGSSIITLYIMLGLVSGVYARPSPTKQERYIRPPLYYQGGYSQ